MGSHMEMNKTRGAELEDQSGTKRKEIKGVAQMKRRSLTPDGKQQSNKLLVYLKKRYTDISTSLICIVRCCSKHLQDFNVFQLIQHSSETENQQTHTNTKLLHKHVSK